MKRNSSIYTLCRTGGCFYLLPYGQGAADMRRGIRLNETGAFLWNELKNTTDREALLLKAAAHYEASEDDIPALRRDICEFISHLTALGALTEQEHDRAEPESGGNGPEPDWAEPEHDRTKPKPDWAEPEHDRTKPEPDWPRPDGSICVRIGQIVLRFAGNLQAFAREFFPFKYEFETEDAGAKNARGSISMTIEFKTGRLRLPAGGKLLIKNEELFVYEQESGYILIFPRAAQVSEAWLEKDGSYACITGQPPVTDTLRTEVFHAIRFLYLYTAQRNGRFAVHSASLLYRGKAWLFCGHSGAGKSTHTNLWHGLYGTPLLNGDLNLLSLSPEMPVVYGMPWCGTSGISDTGTYPLGGIVLLQQASVNECSGLSADQKTLRIFQHMISPVWTEKLLHKNLDFAGSLALCIPCCQLNCTKDPEAADTALAWIDSQA